MRSIINKAMNAKYLFFIVFLLVCVASVSADTCTCDFTEDPVLEGQPQSFICSCSSNNERSQPYSVEWRNQNNTLLETSLGVTPSIKNVPFVVGYQIPFGQGITQINAELTGLNLEGTDNATVTTGSNLTLILTNFTVSSGIRRLGEHTAVRFLVQDINGNNITNAVCSSYATEFGNDNPVVNTRSSIQSYNGVITLGRVLDDINYDESVAYGVTLQCYCLPETEQRCYNSQGIDIGYATGAVEGGLVIGTWIQNISTVNDQTSYNLEDEYISVCANITNVNDFRVPLEISYGFRCDGSDADLDRVIVDENTELRGIDGNTTQNQCALLKLKNLKTTANKVNLCYSSTDICILDNSGDCVVTYSTTSELFNFTSTSSAIEDPNTLTMEVTGMTGLAIVLALVALSAVLLFASNSIKDKEKIAKERILEKALLYFTALVLVIATFFAMYVYASGASFAGWTLGMFLVMLMVLLALIFSYTLYVLQSILNQGTDDDDD